MRKLRLQEFKTLSKATLWTWRSLIWSQTVWLTSPVLLFLTCSFSIFLSLGTPPLAHWVLFSSLVVRCLLDLNLSLRMFLFLHWLFVMSVGNYPFLRPYSTSGWVLEIEDFKKWNPPKINSLFYSSQLCLIELLVSLSHSTDFKGLHSISIPSFRARQGLISLFPTTALLS